MYGMAHMQIHCASGAVRIPAGQQLYYALVVGYGYLLQLVYVFAQLHGLVYRAVYYGKQPNDKLIVGGLYYHMVKLLIAFSP